VVCAAGPQLHHLLMDGGRTCQWHAGWFRKRWRKR
jgi:hypothetical protein